MAGELETNYRQFRKFLPEILPEHRGSYALLHGGEIEAYFPTSLEAIETGLKKFGEGRFSVEEVNDQVEDLGFFSHVTSALQA